MSATRAGGLKAAKTLKDRYGEDHYVRMGKAGGNAYHSKPRGFAAQTPETRRAWCKKGGTASRKSGPNKKTKKWRFWE